MKIQKPRFHYHAHAIALSGEVTHPFHEVIDVQAPATVPPMGGSSSSHTERYRLPGILMHHGARSKATGKYSPEASHTSDSFPGGNANRREISRKSLGTLLFRYSL